MTIFGTHRSAVRRLRLTMSRNLGAGNFFWYACAVADDLDRPLLFHPNGYSLNQLRSQVVRYANWYRGQGIGPGDRVGLYTRNGLYSLLHHIAITSIGAATVHANPKMPAEVAADYFRRTQISLLVGDIELLTACGQGELPDSVLVADEHTVDVEAATLPDVARNRYRHSDGDLVMICHSSGTTGRPKATIFAHRSFFVGKRRRLWTFPSLRSDRLLTALPHSHSAGLSYLSLALMLGLPTLMVDDTSGPAMARAVNQFLPTVVVGFPLTLAELPIEDLSSRAREKVHTWMGMGDASHERHIRPLTELGSSYLDGLGSSEMGMVLFSTVHTPGSSNYGRLIGSPAKVVRDAAVLDEHGGKLPAGQAGLLGVRTPSVTPGYWDDPELTEQSKLSGYFLTGDIVRRDEQGRWFHLDRTPDVITTVAGPVYSLPLEEVVLMTTGAIDAAVIAVDDPEHTGRSVAAAVVLFQDNQVRDADDLLDRCNDALRRDRLPLLRTLLVAADRDELPVGVTGKVLKRELRLRHQHVLTEGNVDARRPR